jgi:hypothetical protein
MPSPNHMYIHTIYVYVYKPMLYEQKTVLLSIIIVQIIFGRLGAWCCMHLTQRQRVPPVLKTFENRIERGFPYDHLRMPTSALATAIHTCICMHIYIYAYIYIRACVCVVGLSSCFLKKIITKWPPGPIEPQKCIFEWRSQFEIARKNRLLFFSPGQLYR